MVKLLRSGKAFSEALCRIQQITLKGSYDPAEYNELQLLNWLVLEYEEKFSCYDSANLDTQPIQDNQQLRVAYSRAD